jgi:UDP-glucose 4-epimerase
MLVGKRIFITGGAGFIGSTVAARVVEKNKVIVYDNLDRDSLKNSSHRNHHNLTLIRGDVLDYPSLLEAVEASQPTHIVHCAAIAGISTTIKKPVHTLEVNVLGSANLLRAANTLGAVERLVCFSTSEVFGQHSFQSDEDSSAVIGKVGVARWAYAVSKLSSEHLTMAYHKQCGLPATVLRPFNIYGPGQVGEGALSMFIQQALDNETIQIHGDGTQIRAWCYIEDMVRAVLLVFENPNAVGETFNIGNKRAVTTIFGLANTVVRVLGSSSRIEFILKDYADVELRVPNVDKARQVLDFEAEVDLEQGILATARSLQQNSKVR